MATYLKLALLFAFISCGSNNNSGSPEVVNTDVGVQNLQLQDAIIDVPQSGNMGGTQQLEVNGTKYNIAVYQNDATVAGQLQTVINNARMLPVNPSTGTHRLSVKFAGAIGPRDPNDHFFFFFQTVTLQQIQDR